MLGGLLARNLGSSGWVWNGSLLFSVYFCLPFKFVLHVFLIYLTIIFKFKEHTGAAGGIP